MAGKHDHEHHDEHDHEHHEHHEHDEHEHDPACDVAHGAAPAPSDGRVLIAVFDSPVARLLLRYGADAGYRPVLVEPDPVRARAAQSGQAAQAGQAGQAGGTAAENGLAVEPGIGSVADGSADVVVTDHHRPELGLLLRDALASRARWVGIMGNPRHPAPHIPALAELGVPPEEIRRVHRPIGINIGSRTPAEIAIATLAGLIADRNDRPGGFTF